MLHNCLSFGYENTAQTRVLWDNCTMLKNFGGLSLTSPKDAIYASIVIAYEDVLRDCGKVWCVQGLIATRSSFVVTWKIRSQMGIIT